MAKISARGAKEIARKRIDNNLIYLLRSDGKVIYNTGYGWRETRFPKISFKGNEFSMIRAFNEWTEGIEPKETEL